MKTLYLILCALAATSLVAVTWTASQAQWDVVILVLYFFALSTAIVCALSACLFLWRTRGDRGSTDGTVSSVSRRRVRPVAAGGTGQPAEPVSHRRWRHVGGVWAVSLLLVACGSSSTGSGGGTDGIQEIPLTETDIEAIELAGGAGGPYLSPCTRIWRHTAEWIEPGGHASGGLAWLGDGSCSVGPFVTDLVHTARILLHEAGHHACRCVDENIANEYERQASTELGLI